MTSKKDVQKLMEDLYDYCKSKEDEFDTSLIIACLDMTKFYLSQGKE